MNIVEKLEKLAVESKDKTAFAYLDQEGSPGGSITYEALYRAASSIASELTRRDMAGKAVMLCFHAGIEFVQAFYGCLIAKAIAVPVHMTKPGKNSWHRLEAIAGNAGATLILSAGAAKHNLLQLRDASPVLNAMEWLDTDRLPPNHDTGLNPVKLGGDDLAFLQYTSGSTGDPKGVMVTHGNIVHNQKVIQELCRSSDESVVVTWLPHYHDLGLIGQLIHTAYLGATCYILPPIGFLQKPVRWLEAMTALRGTISFAPNFAYDLCVQKIGDRDLPRLDLSAWEVALNGAEPVKPATVAKFTERFHKVGFRQNAFAPAYGLAEATLVVSGAKNGATSRLLSKLALKNGVVTPIGCGDCPDPADIGVYASSGEVLRDQEVAIVDPDTCERAAKDQVGEIWISGPSVAAGYWGRSTETEEVFGATIKGKGAKRYLRTGDLGFMMDGELFVAGRKKDIIIIHGENYYPQDIEHIIENLQDEFRNTGCAAFASEGSEGEEVVVFQEIERTAIRGADYPTLASRIITELFTCFGLAVKEVVFLKPFQLPKTSSGKVQRRHCKRLYTEGPLECLYRSSVGQPTEQTDQPNLSKERATQDMDELTQWVKDYLHTRVNSRLMDERRSIAPHIVLDFGNKGLLGMQVAREYGGLALNHVQTMTIFELVSSYDITLGLLLVLNNVLGVRPVNRFASEEIKKELLPTLCTGRALAAFALTERGAGSNPKRIQSMSEKDRAGNWRIDGEKIWSGSATWAGYINVFAKNREPDGRVVGANAFIVKQGSRGLKQGDEALTMGMRAMVQNELTLSGVQVEDRFRLGDVGKGMEVAEDAMSYGRLAIAMMSLGGMKRCVQLMHRYASTRHISTGLLRSNPLINELMSQALIKTHLSEQLFYAIAECLDHDMEVPQEVLAACKVIGPEYLWECSDQLIQVLGGRGYIETNVAPQLMRDARVLRVFEGPTETLLAYIGAQILHDETNTVKFIGTALGATEVAKEVAESIQSLRDNLEGTANDTSGNGKALLHHAIGWLVCAGLQKGALGYRVSEVPVEPDIAAVASNWIRRKYDGLAAELIADRLQGSWAQCEESVVTAAAARITSSLGEYTSGGSDENRTFDEYLAAPLKGTSHPQWRKDQPRRGAGVRVSGSEEIRDKILSWIDQQLNTKGSAGATNKSFAELGVDSILAVELADFAGSLIGEELPSTIVWDYPDVASLVDFVATYGEQADREEQDSAAGADKAVEASYIDSLSEAEALKLLSEL